MSGSGTFLRQLAAPTAAQANVCALRQKTEIARRGQPYSRLETSVDLILSDRQPTQLMQNRAALNGTMNVSGQFPFLDADIVVIGAPMYNFSIPSQLKAWIDRIAVKGKTFAYTEYGPKGMAGDKTVIVASARGGFYGEGTPVATWDHQESYLKAVFGFLGVTDIRFHRAEGLNVSPEQKQKAIHEARGSVANLVAMQARAIQTASVG